jgi:hypothetical protein
MPRGDSPGRPARLVEAPPGTGPVRASATRKLSHYFLKSDLRSILGHNQASLGTSSDGLINLQLLQMVQHHKCGVVLKYAL